MKILFSHSYFMRLDPKQWELKQPYPPLGTILAASVLREAGHSVELFDSQFSFSPEEITPHFQKQQPDVFVLYDDGFNYLTKMCLTNMREAAFHMIGIAKEKKCKVIVCSSDATDHYEKYFDNGADFVIRGEGEITLSELVDALSRNENHLEKISGLLYRENANTVMTPQRSVLKNPDELPLPAWDLIEMGKYRSAWMSGNGYFSLNVATTRGCPFKCNWCAKPIYGNRYNSRSPQKVVEELLMLKEKFQFDHIWFCDDIFGLKPGWVKQFAAEVKKNKLELHYKIQSRADLLLEENTIEALAASGCETVWMGAESGSQKILDAMEKGTTVQQIREATFLLKKYGIRPAFFLQFGYPGETVEDIRMTVDLLGDLLPDDIGISVSYPLPGTKFYENVKAGLSVKQNWSDSDDLALLFQHTYPPEFYRQLHRFVHRNYRKQQGMESLKKLFFTPAKFRRTDIRRAASTLYYIPAAIRQNNKLKKIRHEWS